MVRAQLDDDMSAEETVELAAAGQLYGLEPFDISPSMARDLRREAERERPTNGGPKTELDRTRAIAEATVARVEAMDSPTAKDLHAARQAAQMIRDADREAERQAARERARKPQPKRPTYCRRHPDFHGAPDDAVPCSCPDEPPCMTARLLADPEVDRWLRERYAA